MLTCVRACVQGAQIVCLGTGDPMLESGLQWMEGEFPNSARGWVGFNVPFSHRLTAAADVLLMPSRFEPCGLNQMYAMHYGTVPVAHATGGLRDTVVTYTPAAPDGTTGWAFEGCTVDALKGAIWDALQTYRSAPLHFPGWPHASPQAITFSHGSRISPVSLGVCHSPGAGCARYWASICFLGLGQFCAWLLGGFDRYSG